MIRHYCRVQNDSSFLQNGCYDRKMIFLSDKIRDHKILTNKRRNWQSDQVVWLTKPCAWLFCVENSLYYFDGVLWGIKMNGVQWIKVWMIKEMYFSLTKEYKNAKVRENSVNISSISASIEVRNCIFLLKMDISTS